MIEEPMHLISGNANRPLAEAIARRISVYQGKKVELTSTRVERFNDSEIFVEIFDNVRGQDVFIIQPTSSPANDTLMELMIITDALKRASARRVAAVMPYFGYARQDRKTAGRTPISAKLVADLLQTAGVTQVLTMDLHAGQIQGFFDIPTDNLYAAPVFALDIKHHFGDLSNVTIVSPDVGGVVRARDLAKRIGAKLAIVDKRRSRPGEVDSVTIIGEVENRRCIIIDDICDTAGTLCAAAQLLMDNKAAEVHAYISHGVLSTDGNGQTAADKVENSVLKSLVVTDSIPMSEASIAAPNIRSVSVAPLFAQAILNVKNDTSVSSLFDEDMLGPIYEAFYKFD